MVSLEVLAVAVSKMRKSQKDLSRVRSNKLMNEATANEANVDALLRELAPTNVAIAVDLYDSGRQPQPITPTLFE